MVVFSKLGFHTQISSISQRELSIHNISRNGYNNKIRLKKNPVEEFILAALVISISGGGSC